MPIKFVNGGAPTYFGQQVNSINAYLGLIRDTLVNAGWTTITDSIVGASPFIEMRGNSANSHVCYFRFQAISGQANADTMIRDRAYANIFNGGGGTSYNVPAEQYDWANWQDSRTGFADWRLDILASQNSIFSITSRDNYNMPIWLGKTRIWLTATADSFVLCHGQPFSQWGTRAIYGGFQERIDDTDPYAWGIGFCHTDVVAHETARLAYDNATNWLPLSKQTIVRSSLFTNNSNAYAQELTWYGGNLSSQAPLNQGLIDRFTSTCCRSASADFYGYTASSKQYWLGARNRLDDSYVLGKAFLTEGRNNAGNYPYSELNIESFGFYFRGYIQNVYTGMASALPYIKVQDCDGGAIYMSTGGPGHLAMRIS